MKLINKARDVMGVTGGWDKSIRGLWDATNEATFNTLLLHREHYEQGPLRRPGFGRPALSEMYFADDVSPVPDALSALAYTYVLIVAANANGLQTNARKSKLVADSHSEEIVNFLFSPLRGGDHFTDVVRASHNGP